MSNRKYDIDNKVFLEDKKMIVQHTQDCEAAIEQVKHLKNINGGKSGLGYHAARIPQVLLMEWAYEDCGNKLAYLQGKHNKDPELAKKLAVRLNSNEFNQLRIWDGNIASSDMLKEGNKFK